MDSTTVIQTTDSIVKEITHDFNLAMYMSTPYKYQVRTSHGVAVRIICTDKDGLYPIVGMLPDVHNKFSWVTEWDAKGESKKAKVLDLKLVESFIIEGFELNNSIGLRPWKQDDGEVLHDIEVGNEVYALSGKEVEQLYRRLQQYVQQIETFNKE